MSEGGLTRGQVAKLLGCSVSSVRRLEQDGRLHPVVGERGVRHFHRGEVDRLRREREQAEGTDAAPAPALSAELVDGQTASRVFELFEQGASAVEVVEQEALGPDRVQALHRAWLELRALSGDLPDGAQRLEALEQWVEDFDTRLQALEQAVVALSPLYALVEPKPCRCAGHAPTRTAIEVQCGHCRKTRILPVFF